MGWSLWDVFRSWASRSDGDADAGDDDSFVPSPMDLSVRFSHGGSDSQVQRELTDIEQQADELEEHQHDR